MLSITFLCYLGAMCDACSAKMLELDARVPHFIDWVQGGRGSDRADAVKVREAFREYQDFRRATHGAGLA